MAALLLIGVAELPAQDTAGAGGVRGAVVDGRGDPAPDVAVCVPAVSRCVVSDRLGRFTLTDIRSGRYTLEIVAPGAPPLATEVEVRAGRESLVEVTLTANEGLQETITVTAPSFVAAEEVKTSAFLASAAEVAQSAGALQDVSRYVQSLPGAVIGTDDFRNDLIVRGGSPLENLYIVDNVEIPNINTFANFASAGGTVSMLDAQLLQDVTFLTGGYPAAYGNRTSSVLQLALREGSRERRGGRATFGFAGMGGIAEGPLDRGRGSWAVSLRRSFLDLVTDDVGIGGVPVLYTVNAKATYDLTPVDRIWLLNVTGIDNVRLGLTENSDLSDELSNLDIRYRGGRSATGFNWQRTFGARGVGLLGASYSRAWVRSTVADLLLGGVPLPGTPVQDQLASAETVFREDSAEGELTIKYDLTAYVPVVGKLQGGASVKRTAVNYDTASPFGTDSPYFVEPDQNPFALRQQEASYVLGSYVQASRALTRRLNLTTGARLDRFGYLSETRLSPRLGLAYDLTPRLSLRASGGRYYQQPFALFVAAYPENRSLKPFRADHTVGGLHWTPAENTRVTAEAYHKRYGAYPVSSQIPSLSLANIGDTFALRDVLFPMVSLGTGAATGIEFLAERRSHSGARWSGQANLALSRARHAGADTVRRPGSFDYPVVANIVATGHLTNGWDLSVRMAYLSARPYTPIDLEAARQAGRAVFDTSRVNAERSSDYFRADVRVDRVFTLNGRSVRVFGGLQNVTNRRNIAGFTWDRRNNMPRTLEQLGLFPILGLDWQF
jgi:hypothetical protein